MKGGNPLACKDSYRLDRLLSIYPEHESFSDKDCRQFQLGTLLGHFRRFHLLPISQFLLLRVHLCHKRYFVGFIMCDLSCDECALHHNTASWLTVGGGGNVGTVNIAFHLCFCNENSITSTYRSQRWPLTSWSPWENLVVYWEGEEVHIYYNQIYCTALSCHVVQSMLENKE